MLKFVFTRSFFLLAQYLIRKGKKKKGEREQGMGDGITMTQMRRIEDLSKKDKMRK